MSRSILAADDRALIVSPQVLGEFYVTVTRKLKPELAPQDARAAVDAFSEFGVRPLTGSLVRAATLRSERSRLSYWDALVVETAIEAGAAVLLSEDMQHGQVLGSLTIRNPYR